MVGQMSGTVCSRTCFLWEERLLVRSKLGIPGSQYLQIPYLVQLGRARLSPALIDK